MTSSAALSVAIRKEARALLPTWAACAAALIVVSVGEGRAAEAGRLLYILGSLALASWSIGHEYTHRTLPILLSLPSTRPRLLLVKLAVLIPMLATLGALAVTTLPPLRGYDRQEFESLIPALSLVCALLLAPLLTMLCRSPLAGIMFAAGLTGSVHTFSQLAGLVLYGSAPAVLPDREQFALGVRFLGLVSVSAVAAVADWRAFMQLEAIDGLPDVQWPHRWRRVATSVPIARRRNKYWLLVFKELRLQQMTFIVTGLFILGGTAIWMLSSVIPKFNGSPEPMVALNGLMLSWLVGSLASAEERHLGTLEWQTLLPVAAWQQWIVKAGVTLGLAILLGIGLPLLFAIDGPQLNPVYAGVLVVLTTTSLYVSTLCSSGIRTLTVSGPAILIVFLPLGRYIRPFDADLMSPVGMLMLTGLLLLALRFAFENHRSAGRDFKRVGRQLLIMAAVPVIALIMRQF